MIGTYSPIKSAQLVASRDWVTFAIVPKMVVTVTLDIAAVFRVELWAGQILVAVD
jgi:hypothetical protein